MSEHDNTPQEPKAPDPNREIRLLVDGYMMNQMERIRWANRNAKEESEIFDVLSESFAKAEVAMRRRLEDFCLETEPGRWLLSLTGFGPVLAAGTLAFINPEKTNTAGKVWSYAGLATRPQEDDPNLKLAVRRKKGEVLNYNPSFRRLCFLIGDSIVKSSGRSNSFYGPLYKQRVQYEHGKNERKEYAAQAAYALAHYKFSPETEAYKAYIEGYLPKAHLYARAKRWAVKMFLSHAQEVIYSHHFKALPPAPYVMVHMGHTDYLPPPQWNRETFEVVYPKGGKVLGPKRRRKQHLKTREELEAS